DMGAGTRALNSPIAHVPVGYAGPDSDSGDAFLQTAGRYNLALADDVLGGGYSLLTIPMVRSLQLSARREFTDRIEAFVDASRYENQAEGLGSLASTTNIIL